MVAKTVKIPIVKKKVKTKIAIGGLIVAIIILYVLKDRIPFLSKIFNRGIPEDDDIPFVDIAPKVQFEIIPDNVRPNSFVNLVGSFTDDGGNPVRVSQGYYYVFEKGTLQGNQLIAQGSLGTNVSSFNHTIPTTNFRSSLHTIRVTDFPLSQDQIGPLNIGPRNIGIGEGISPNTPFGQMANPRSPDVTIS